MCVYSNEMMWLYRVHLETEVLMERRETEGSPALLVSQEKLELQVNLVQRGLKELLAMMDLM